jgi:hypothetical protein
MRARWLTPLLLPLLFVVGGCGDEVTVGQSPDPHAKAAGWKRLPDPPLSPRLGQVTVWTGSEVIVVGGDIGDPCPPNADCARATAAARDGAAYDPAARTWRPIADAPVTLPAYTAGVVVKGHLFVRHDNALLDYDVATDRWTTLPRPVSEWYALVADGHRLVLVSGSDEDGDRPDLAYDVATERWSELPADPIGPAFNRGLIATPAGLVLTAQELVPNPGADGPSLVLAALLDRKTGRWTRLPDTGQLGGGSAGWTGTRIVDPSLGGADGGEVGNYGRTIPFGGIIDPVAKTWSPLPNPPHEFTGGWSVEAVGPALIAANGWIYNDSNKVWTEIPRPAGAPEQPGRGVWTGSGFTLVVIGGSDRDEPRAADAYVTAAWSWDAPAGLAY